MIDNACHTTTPEEPRLPWGELIPDAMSALADDTFRGTALIKRQHRRRAAILAAARQQISTGSEAINITQIADRCSLAIQTVYNITGDRDATLAMAIDEYHQKLLSVASRRLGSMSVFEDVRDALWLSARTNPDYHRNLIVLYFARHDVARSAIQKRMILGLRDMIRSITVCNRSSIEARDYSASRLQALIAMSAGEWSGGKVSLGQLRSRLTEDFEMVLSRAVRGYNGLSCSDHTEQ